MVNLDEFPDWDGILEYFEVTSSELLTKVANENEKINYEDLLNLETYQLWKLLKKM